MKHYYVDHAATTPLDTSVLEKMLPFMQDVYGNPSSLHQMGIEVKRAINEARSSVADMFFVSANNVIFTSGGTESTNLAIRGYASTCRERREIISTVIEHHATLNTLKALEDEGYIIHLIDVDEQGFILFDQLIDKLSEKTLMVSIIWANNEIGTIQDIKKIGELCHKFGAKLHVDAVQMVAHHHITFHDFPIDFLTLSAHKFYGPKGIGALIIRDGLKVNPIIFGGHQEHGIRSGTENVYGIVGLKTALEIKNHDRVFRQRHLNDLTDDFLKMVKESFPEVIINGPKNKDVRLPGLISLSFPNINSQSFAFALDRQGVFLSTGSACLSNEVLESHVLRAIKVKPGYGTLRLSFGKDTRKSDLKIIWSHILNVYEDMKDEEEQ